MEIRGYFLPSAQITDYFTKETAINMEITINRKTILWGLIFVGAIAFQIFVVRLWLNTPPSKTKHLTPLLNEINSYQIAHGQYPLSFESLSSFTNIKSSFAVYAGERTTNGVEWQPDQVSNHDFTILVMPKCYQVFLPVGHMKMVSFSSFAV